MTVFRMGASALLVAGMLAGVALVPAAAFADGAIAANRHGQAGISYRFKLPSDAERRALHACGKGDCRIVAHFRKRCAALASGDNGHFGYSARPQQRDADTVAVNECHSSGGGAACAVKVRGCD